MKQFQAITAIVVLCAMIAISGRFAFFQLHLRSLKADFRHRVLSQSSLPILKLSLKKNDLYVDSGPLQWKDNNKEVVLNGVFHEVVKVILHGDSVTVYLIEDKYESDLYRRYIATDHRQETASWYHLLGCLQTILSGDGIQFNFISDSGETRQNGNDPSPPAGHAIELLRPPCIAAVC